MINTVVIIILDREVKEFLADKPYGTYNLSGKVHVMDSDTFIFDSFEWDGHTIYVHFRYFNGVQWISNRFSYISLKCDQLLCFARELEDVFA